jgi:hypothetical protein
MGTPEFRVDLRPRKSAIAGEAYVATFFENGKYRDHTDVSFTQAEINVGSAVVYFPATQDEEDAYCKIDAEATRNQKVYQDIITIDLRDIFSVVVCETIAVDFATLSKIHIEPCEDCSPAGYYYCVVIEFTPTDNARAGESYSADLYYTDKEGRRRLAYSEEVEWTQEEISSHATSKLSNCGSTKELCEAVVNGSPELEVAPY